MVRRLRSMAETTPSRSPLIRVMSEASHGHVGARPDGDADVGLGQGRRIVDPVADHGHRRPRTWSLRISSALSPGRTSATTSSIPASRGAWLRRVRRSSPVSMTTSRPMPRQPRDGGRGARLQRVGERDEPGRHGRRRRRRRRSCLPRRSVAASRRAHRRPRPLSPMSFRLPTRTARPPTRRPRRRCPRGPGNRRAPRDRGPFSAALRTTAWPSGCSERLSAPAASDSGRRLRRTGEDDVGDLGLARGSACRSCRRRRCRPCGPSPGSRRS